MNVGLGNAEIISKDVRGDIDFTFFDDSDPKAAVKSKIKDNLELQFEENKLKNGNENLNSAENDNLKGNGDHGEAKSLDKDEVEKGDAVNGDEWLWKHRYNDEVILQCMNLYADNHITIPIETIKYSDVLKEMGFSDDEGLASEDSDFTNVSQLSSDEESISPVSSDSYSEDEFDQEISQKEFLEAEKNPEIKPKTAEETLEIIENESNGSPFTVPKVSSGMELKFLVEAMQGMEVDDKKNCPEGENGRQSRNMTFSNEAILNIDRENQRLLNRLIRIKTKKRSKILEKMQSSNSNRLSSATLNRQREQKRIEQENMAMLRRLNGSKPTKEITKEHLLKQYEKKKNYADDYSKPFQTPQSTSSSVSSHQNSPKITTYEMSSNGTVPKKRPEWNDRW